MPAGPVPARKVSSFAEGQVLFGRFRILRFIAQGGMGSVYEAEDLELKERIALKTLLPEISQDPAALKRFIKEVSLARKVTHPNVSRIYDVFHHLEQGVDIAFLTMELLEGIPLSDYMHRKGPLIPQEALPIVRQMLQALSAAHRAGIAHRDFKPNNVMVVSGSGDPGELRTVVTDFGLAHGFGASGMGTTVSGTTGFLAGTPAYMAPEQVEGKPATPLSDLYALGLVVYEMLTGKPAFSGSNLLSLATARLTEPPPDPRRELPDLDLRWVELVLKCLAKEPEARWQSADQILEALEARTPKVSLPAFKVHRTRNRHWGRIAAVALLTVLAGGLAWVLSSHERRLQASLVWRKAFKPFQIMTGHMFRNPVGMEFVKIPAGTFTMGSTRSLSKSVSDKFRPVPAHSVTISRPFLMQTTEVTLRQFRTFVEATNYRTEGENGDGIRISKGRQAPSANQGYLVDRWGKRADANWRNPYFDQGDDGPVVGVSWNDAQAFLVWLNERDPGRNYRLPTEAEWEHACRAGTSQEEAYGSTYTIAWVAENSGFHPHPVAGRQPNALGLYDMLGNVSEWCQDWYARYTGDPVTDPSGPTWGTQKVIRGGGWCHRDDDEKLTPVLRWPAAGASDDLGFRVVADAVDP